MRRYDTFPFDDHTAYLQQMECLLRTLSAQGVHTTVTLFDPAAYAAFCAEHHLDPDAPGSRSRYTAERACTGAALPYSGQPLHQLLPVLIEASEHRATWEYASSLLSVTGACPDCGEDLAHAAFARASLMVTRLLEALGPGTHHLVCSVPADGIPLLAALHTTSDDGTTARLSEPQTRFFCTVLAAGIALKSPGGIVSRTTTTAPPDAPPGTERETVRGWSLRDSWPRPLSAAEVFTAYCTDAETGAPVPPEPGVDHHPGIPLPPPPEEPHHH
ncbi:hypothetical protein [Streptomyces sp. NPDC003077]|uniref:hypothetical protein n=1 Tax=Streptomyces sp. NPDC003077 TaxID=3154443 RepID=UPI0033BA11C3